jgi:hypothetical protein
MATLLLDRIWVNLLSTGDAVSARGQIGRSSEFSIDGEVRTYAGGRRRAVTKAGEISSYSCTLQDVTLTQRDTLRSWFDQAVQVRDHRGQIFRGVILAVGVAERTYELDLYEISFTLQSTTVDEGV